MCAGTMGQIMRVWLTKTAFIHLEKYGMYIVIPKARYTEFFGSLREYQDSSKIRTPHLSGHHGYLADQDTSQIRTSIPFTLVMMVLPELRWEDCLSDSRSAPISQQQTSQLAKTFLQFSACELESFCMGKIGKQSEVSYRRFNFQV